MRRLIRMAPLFGLMTLGICACGPERPVPVERLTAVVDTAPVRCPPVDGATRQTFAAGPPARPLPDVKTGAGAYLSADATRAYIDRLEVAIAVRNRTGQRLVGEYERCARHPQTAPLHHAAQQVG